MDKECIDGLMAESIAGIGSAIKCMAKVYSPGLMAVNMMANTLMIRNRVTVYLHGLTDASMTDIG